MGGMNKYNRQTPVQTDTGSSGRSMWMRNPFDNTPPQPPRSIVSLPIQLLYALFSSYPLFTVPPLSLSLSLSLSLFLSRFLCSELLLPFSAGFALLCWWCYPSRSLVLVPISSRRSCPICPAPVLCTEEKGRHGSSPLFWSYVGCVGSDRGEWIRNARHRAKTAQGWWIIYIT